MADIVFVHGIAQEQSGPDLLERKWVPALASGVRIAGQGEVADRIVGKPASLGPIECRMAFYGHLFLEEGVQGAGGTVADEGLSPLETALAVAWLERYAATTEDPIERAEIDQSLATIRGERIDGQMGTGAAAATHLIKQLAHSRWFARVGFGIAERFVVRALSQVRLYLSDSEIRDVAQSKVLELINAKTRVVVGHSLGSVVAYEALRQIDRPIPLLVTIGSPLGLANIVHNRLEPKPVIYPPCVKRWVNVTAPDDIVASERNLSPLFPEVPADASMEGPIMIDNGSLPHDCHHYLTKQAVGRPVGAVFVTSG